MLEDNISTNIVKESTLTLIDLVNNTNKFYRIKLYDDDTVTMAWGRVGVKNPQSTFKKNAGIAYFEKTIKNKLAKGYVENKNILESVKDDKTIKRKVLFDQVTAHLDDSSVSPINETLHFLVNSNNHDLVKSHGDFNKIGDKSLKITELGVISKESIKEARGLLDLIEENSLPSEELDKLKIKYLTLIPQKISTQKGMQDFFDNPQKITKQRNLLKRLITSSNRYIKDEKDESLEEKRIDLNKATNFFKIKLNEISNEQLFQQLQQTYYDSAHSSFSKSLDIKNIFELKYDDDLIVDFDILEQRNLSPIQTLWHGTGNRDVLSILREGFSLIPENKSNYYLSRDLLRDGIYFTDNSAKALTYSSSTTRSPAGHVHGFLFLADVIMGNSNKTNLRSFTRRDLDFPEHESVIVEDSSSEITINQIFVKNTEQIKLKYLFELTG